MTTDVPLGRNRDFQRLLWGRTTQMTGGAMTALALMLYAVDLTGDVTWGAGVMAANTIGTLAMSLPAGVLVDRWNRVRVMVATSLALALVLLSVPVAAALGILVPGQLVVVSVLVGALSTFFGPAEQASLQLVVAEQDQPAAASLNQARSAIANLLGPSLAGVLYAVAHFLPLLLDAVLNLVAALLVLRIRQPLPTSRTRGSRSSSGRRAFPPQSSASCRPHVVSPGCWAHCSAHGCCRGTASPPCSSARCS